MFSTDRLFDDVSKLLREITGMPIRYHHLRHSFATYLYIRLSVFASQGACFPLSYNGEGDPHYNDIDWNLLQRAVLSIGMGSFDRIDVIAEFMGHVSPTTTFLSYIHSANFIHRLSIDTYERALSRRFYLDLFGMKDSQLSRTVNRYRHQFGRPASKAETGEKVFMRELHFQTSLKLMGNKRTHLKFRPDQLPSFESSDFTRFDLVLYQDLKALVELWNLMEDPDYWESSDAELDQKLTLLGRYMKPEEYYDQMNSASRHVQLDQSKPGPSIFNFNSISKLDDMSPEERARISFEIVGCWDPRVKGVRIQDGASLRTVLESVDQFSRQTDWRLLAEIPQSMNQREVLDELFGGLSFDRQLVILRQKKFGEASFHLVPGKLHGNRLVRDESIMAIIWLMTVLYFSSGKLHEPPETSQ